MSQSLYVLFGGLILVLLYDLWVVIKKGVNATISVQLYHFTEANPIIAFVFGVLAGHLFWGNPGACG